LILIEALYSACWEKKEREEKKEKWPEGFLFPRAGHTFLVVPYRIFVAVRCN
jgi:hypothetical protein